ncbi:MAG: hypothetical protein CVT80_07755 [Alphaproteobacteria bacterium HGW-Alphaproteobacteria-2]|nr:MAG: hypothetical protein CVT80_07755 [Alphaproteobacteria bacterium HGW-Alphaproteobacteria-2]
MSGPAIAALAALFLWWFSTGAILVVVRRADRSGAAARRMAVLAALPVLLAGIWGHGATLDTLTPATAYGAFLSTLAIWGWIELAFLTGLITGPNLRPCPRGLPEWERFLRAWGTIAYHEMLLAAVLAAMLINGWAAENPVGVWSYTVLFAARVSAKLNLFFGVPRVNTEFLPAPLSHLPSHFRAARFNWLFPVSVTLLSLATACWLERLWAADTAGAAIGHALLAAITALALLEHWLMVLPLPDAKLWRWMLPAPNPSQETARTEEPHGF